MKKSISVNLKEFYEFGKSQLDLECVTGEEHLDRNVQEAIMNRPGLALSGFQKYFANDRIQVFGLAEYAYLRDLSQQQRKKSLENFFKHKFPCLILARNRKALPEMMELAEKYEIPILRTSMVTYDFIHSATMLIDHITAPQKKLPGTMMDIRGIGVLIQGEPRIGKSETALGLLDMGHSLVADEVTLIRRSSWGGLMGSAVELTRFHMEIRGLGIIHVPSLYGITSVRAEKQLDMIVNLQKPTEEEISNKQTGAENNEHKAFFGIKIPLIRVLVRSGRNIAQIVEAAALNQKLKQLGHDATKELDARVISELIQKRGVSD
ncbi:MAG: HPr(Ser) kinase/phosphatase [Desulfatiglandaceae bacterium]